MSCLVIYSRAFLKTELTETVTNALIIYRLLVGGSPSQYADISMNVKKENDTDETHKFLGNLNLTIYPKDVNLNLIPVRSDIPTEPAPRAKRAYIYMLCVQKVMKLVLFISGTVKNPEEEVHNTSLYKSLQRLYERLSTDLDLSGELKDVCEQFVDSERFWINYTTFFNILAIPDAKSDVAFDHYSSEDGTRFLLSTKALLMRIKYMCEDVLPPLKEFGIVTSLSADDDGAISEVSLQSMAVYFDQAVRVWPESVWKSLYSVHDIFSPKHLFAPVIRKSETTFRQESSSSVFGPVTEPFPFASSSSMTVKQEPVVRVKQEPQSPFSSSSSSSFLVKKESPPVRVKQEPQSPFSSSSSSSSFLIRKEERKEEEKESLFDDTSLIQLDRQENLILAVEMISMLFALSLYRNIHGEVKYDENQVSMILDIIAKRKNRNLYRRAQYADFFAAISREFRTELPLRDLAPLFTTDDSQYLFRYRMDIIGSAALRQLAPEAGRRIAFLRQFLLSTVTLGVSKQKPGAPLQTVDKNGLETLPLVSDAQIINLLMQWYRKKRVNPEFSNLSFRLLKKK